MTVQKKPMSNGVKGGASHFMIFGFMHFEKATLGPQRIMVKSFKISKAPLLAESPTETKPGTHPKHIVYTTLLLTEGEVHARKYLF